MKFLHPYKDDPARVREMGLFAIVQLESAAGQIDAEPCPFCGGSAALGITSAYGNTAVFIQCAECSVRTELYVAGMNAVTLKNVTPIERLKQAAAVWNKRVG